MTITYQSHYRTSWALVIGINSYEHVPPLNYACNDADSVAAILTNQLGFPADQVTILKDQQATKHSILEAFHSFGNKADHPDDRVFVFYAGHGHTLQGNRGHIGYLVPVDGNPSNTNSLIRWDELTLSAELIKAKHILFIMDACYSGLAMQRATTPGTKRFLSDILQRLSRQVLTAGKADQQVADGGGAQGRNSIFTGYLIDALQGQAADANGIITANSLMHYVYQKVSQDPRSKQTPHYGHIDGDGDFVLSTPDGEHFATESVRDFVIPPFVEHPESTPVESVPATRTSYAISIGYGDPSNANFGRNDLTQKLGELRITKGDSDHRPSYEMSKAFSWLSLIAEPATTQSISYNVADEVQKLSDYSDASMTPLGRLLMPRESRTTSDSVIFYDDDRYERRTPYWTRYFRLSRSGNMEYVSCASSLFKQWQEYRFFSYVQIVGLVGLFALFAKQQLDHVGYTAGVDLYVNLVGTRNTILYDFANKTGQGGQRWAQPMGADSLIDLDKITCSDANLQMKYKLPLSTLDEKSVFNTMRDVASQLGLAYNHQSSPRCFNSGTEVFPWDQFSTGQR